MGIPLPPWPLLIFVIRPHDETRRHVLTNDETRSSYFDEFFSSVVTAWRMTNDEKSSSFFDEWRNTFVMFWRMKKHVRHLLTKLFSSFINAWGMTKKNSSSFDQWRNAFVIFWQMTKVVRHLLTNDETLFSSFVSAWRRTNDEKSSSFFDEWQNEFVIFWRMRKHFVKFGPFSVQHIFKACSRLGTWS